MLPKRILDTFEVVKVERRIKGHVSEPHDPFVDYGREFFYEYQQKIAKIILKRNGQGR
jgi:hypothetical protein